MNLTRNVLLLPPRFRDPTLCLRELSMIEDPVQFVNMQTYANHFQGNLDHPYNKGVTIAHSSVVHPTDLSRPREIALLPACVQVRELS